MIFVVKTSAKSNGQHGRHIIYLYSYLALPSCPTNLQINSMGFSCVHIDSKPQRQRDAAICSYLNTRLKSYKIQSPIAMIILGT